MLQHSHLE